METKDLRPKAFKMKSRWKSVFIWSSLGGVLLGAVVALAKKGKPAQAPALECHKIPPDCQTVSLWTEQFRAGSDPDAHPVQDKYVLRATPFKVWSVLGRVDSSPEGRAGGSAVYHVTHVRYAESTGGQGYPDEGRLQDRFYGTPAVLSADGKRSPSGHIARGGILEIRKCLVGGGNNGVETGEVHQSAAPILNYRFEYISA